MSDEVNLAKLDGRISWRPGLQKRHFTFRINIYNRFCAPLRMRQHWDNLCVVHLAIMLFPSGPPTL